jgi:hypothetical protein
VAGVGPLRLQLMRNGDTAIEVPVPDSDHHDTGVVATHGDAVFVAHHKGIATGTTLTRFDSVDGHVVWSTTLEGIEITGHSQYRNEVQIAIEGGNPVVFGHEAQGDYTEIVDAHTGKTIAHGQPEQALTAMEFWFRDEPAPTSVATLVVGDRTFVFREAQQKGEDAEVVQVVGDAPYWSRKLPGNDFCGRAVMHELFGTLWIVRFCSIATGAELVGIDVKSGDVRVTRPLRGVPEIAHSRYSAAVQMRDVAGYLVVMGRESGGRYLEAIHPSTGATVVSRTWK